jgi:monoamine oxidase
VKRRKALKQIGWGISGGLLLPSLLDACSPNDPGPEISYDGNVAIIGAGAAGLYAADILRSKGVKVIIFEAHGQLGGRVCSLRNQPVEQYPYTPQLSSDFPIELGPQTITGSDSILGKIYKDYNLTTIELATADNNFVLGNEAKTESGWNGDADYIAARTFKDSLPSFAGNGQTVQTAAQGAPGINARNLGMINGQISNFHGSNSEKIGIGALGDDAKLNPTDGKVLMLRSNPMQDILISRFSEVQPFVKLSTPITSINYSADKVILTAKDGTTFEANKVIVTVPVSILKNGSMTFSPALPATFTSSLAKFDMGASLRVLLEFKKNFWGPATGFIWGSTNVPEYLNAGRGSTFNQTLTITINGDKAAQYSALGDGVVDAIIADLDLIYAGQASQFVRKDVITLKTIFIREDWTTKQYILGGYAYPLAGATIADRKSIGTQVGEKIFFAGEATDVSGQAGMVNGALASAERVVEEVVVSIKKTI